MDGLGWLARRPLYWVTPFRETRPEREPPARTLLRIVRIMFDRVRRRIGDADPEPIGWLPVKMQKSALGCPRKPRSIGVFAGRCDLHGGMGAEDAAGMKPLCPAKSPV